MGGTDFTLNQVPVPVQIIAEKEATIKFHFYKSGASKARWEDKDWFDPFELPLLQARELEVKVPGELGAPDKG